MTACNCASSKWRPSKSILGRGQGSIEGAGLFFSRKVAQLSDLNRYGALPELEVEAIADLDLARGFCHLAIDEDAAGIGEFLGDGPTLDESADF